MATTQKTKATASTYTPKIVKLTASQARELVEQGVAMRREIEARYAQMKVITEDDLKLRAR
jgi:hypothetical protein